MTFDAQTTLVKNGARPDSEINILHVALAFAEKNHKGIVVERYLNHVAKMVVDVGDRYIALLNAGAQDDARTQLAALKHILCDREGYKGDTETYNDLQNADIMRVIDRRMGMPIALAILYIHVGRANGWDVDGLNFPGHFLCRIQKGAMRLIFDPFSDCALMEAPDLRALLKKAKGPNAELSADYYQPCGNRDVLFRLQNNIKLRLIEMEEYAEALKSVELMQMLDKEEPRLMFDAGVLYMKIGKPRQAVDVLRQYMSKTPNQADKADAQRLIDEIAPLIT